jgi:hypothetical protein
MIRFQLRVSRFMAPSVRRVIRDIAFDHDVDVEFEEERGWVFFDLYGTLTGERQDCEDAMDEVDATIAAHNRKREA